MGADAPTTDRDALPSGPAPAELPTDLPRRAAGPYRAALVESALPEDVAALLDAMAGTGRSPVPTHLPAQVPAHLPTTADHPPSTVLLLAVAAAVVHRHTRTTDLLIGLDGDGVGAFSHPSGPLAIRVRLAPAEPFTTLAGAVEEAVTDALGSAREPDGAAAAPRIVVTARASCALPYQADISLALARDATGAVLRLRYDATLFTSATAVWLLGHCATLLSGAVRDPRRRVRELPVQDGLKSIADPAPDGRQAAGAGPDSLVDRFRAVAAEHGARTAVSGPSGEYSYARLDRTTTFLAHRLGRRAAPGSRVALLCEHDVQAVLGVWAALKAGVAYVPLDPRQPDGRLARIVTDADVAVVACDPALADRAAALAGDRPVIPLSPADGSASGDMAPPGADTLAYVLHTSGTTGAPKGVMQTHGNVLGHATLYAEQAGIAPGDRVPLLARFTFDAAVMDLFGALLTGASLHIVDPLLSAPDLRARLAAVGATLLHCTPTLFRHLVGDLPPERKGAGPEESLSGVRTVVLGGEEATGQDLRRFSAVFPDNCTLINGLGPTECTLALQYRASRFEVPAGALPVGRPVPGVEVRLLDGDGLPTEVYGEVELVSERLAVGYWNQPEATAGAFGTRSDGVRSYRTGDFARRRADGALVFTGREDRQLKVRGHRVEPGEIEAALRAHPTVAQAAAVPAHHPGGLRIVGYVSPATVFAPDPDDLRRYLESILPDYAVPWRILTVESMPLGPTGKLDRTRLPAPPADADSDSGTDPAGEPRTEAERAVARLWCHVLGVRSVAVNTNFMAAGGDSVRLLQMLSAVRDELSVEIPLMDFLSSPTVATVARIVERERPC
ncbi:amino acid adenylation domain-containing protein [Streptomyces sp. ME19-01-6]|uniref:amino acid adenylation domain-containing protein n=1 Tax=Streptomyces sp. ME19-01-6 TaxID=3028686 RepID=UPI0029B2377E|nr:amino acid adenylation domain-containing protein [Streptomyces sp. ME19-01-6]MDX3228658.1 amino acid adenylation domain-containing protein [Streptomyces sp. ME19-01-6]